MDLLNGKYGLIPQHRPKMDVYPGEIVIYGEKSGSFQD